MGKCEEKDLVVLQFVDNTCYTQVKNVLDAMAEHKSLSVDLEKGTWKYDGEELKIGKSRYDDKNYRYGIIGVYDRSNDEHLDNMVHDSTEAIRSRANCLFSN